MTNLTREQLDELSQTEPEPYGETQVVRVYYSDWQIIVAQARRALELEGLLPQVATWKSAMSDWYKELDRERPGANGILVYKDRVQERLVRISLMLPTCSPDDAINAALDAAEKSRE